MNTKDFTKNSNITPIATLNSGEERIVCKCHFCDYNDSGKWCGASHKIEIGLTGKCKNSIKFYKG